jgi:hypothetical protein
MFCVLVLLMIIDMMVVACWTYSNLLLSLLGWLYSSFYIQWGKGYKKANRIGYNMIPIKTLSLPTYFTYIFIYIIIYALESKPWSFGIFWMVAES